MACKGQTESESSCSLRSGGFAWSIAQISSIVWPYSVLSKLCFKPCKPKAAWCFPVKYQAGSSEPTGMCWKSHAKGIPGTA